MRTPYSSHPPDAIASDAWMLEQQLRAEWEAAEWRRLRAELSQPLPALAYAPPARRPWYEGGSIILKGLVRFALGAFGAYLGWIAAASGVAGEFEIWLSVGAGFIIALALSALGPAKQFVALLAEITRWSLILATGVGTVWLISQIHSA